MTYSDDELDRDLTTLERTIFTAVIIAFYAVAGLVIALAGFGMAA